MSRRAFELRFRDVVGRTPYHELRRVRIQRAQQLLLETDMPISQVATASGFSSAAYLAQVFQKQLSKTPAQFRNEHRA